MCRKLIHHNILFLVFASLLSLQQIHSASTTEALEIDSSRRQEGLLVQGRAATSPRHQHIISAQSHDATQELRQAGVPYVSGLDSLQTVFDEGANLYIPRLAKTGDSIQDFNLEQALHMGHITSVAYCSDAAVIMSWTCTRCRRVEGFQIQEVVFDQEWDLLGFAGYDSTRDAVVVAFRGTDSHSWGNWINNMRAWRANKMYPIPEAPRAQVHAGFYDLWTRSSLQANITRAVGEILAVHPTPRLFVTGHSMGGALSSLAALDLKFKHEFSEVRSWTFGSPRVGNLAWQQLFDEHVVESWRFTHNRDVVPSLPPQIIGFHHVAREAWTVDYAGPGGIVEQKILICDESGEDPSCHNSACMLGLCTSIADHLVYLGVEMYKSLLEC